jgi:hypothetical protein
MPPPAGRTRWGLYAGVTSVAALVGCALLIFLRSATTHATPPAEMIGNATVAPPVVAPAAPPSAAPPSPAPSSAPSAPPVATTEVLVSVEPMDAKVVRDGADLGALPIALKMKAGEKASLVITRGGYRTQTVTVDGSQARVVLKMERAGGGSGGRGKPAEPKGAPPPPPPASGSGIQDFQDPFLKK